MTFGKKLAMTFIFSSVLLIAVGTVAYRSIVLLTQTSYSVAHSHQVLEHISTVASLLKDAETGQRGYVITGDEPFLEPYNDAISKLPAIVRDLRELTRDNVNQQRRMDEMEPLVSLKLGEMKRTLDARRSNGFESAAKIVAAGEGKRTMDDLRRVLSQMEREERDLLKQRADEVEGASSGARSSIAFGTLLSLLLVTAVGFAINRSLNSQIGSAVQHMQSSSTELQSAATQQVSGSKEQATAMTQITTTVSELLATSRQIAESAQRVAQVASETATAAKSGDQGMQRTQESVAGIRRQVDQIVGHMLELGKKSQQIGGILEIINELAEQTNILAINATIEAVGAGETGKRFAIVADEVRKLADRVGGSIKEIRVLVDDIRASVNTTVMATESGSKAVDAGVRQIGDVASSLKHIAGLVTTTTEASREIELSTKQQATAVEQVNVAVANVAQAAKETETSSNQTLQTATQLANLSRDLSRIIRPPTLASA
ncbi:MAG TPA: CHASE3 domain-containing protein [Polyangiaceae bacterium]|nr:CHASE3 domain-containing protein [Polyangiaceae bacterium]